MALEAWKAALEAKVADGRRRWFCQTSVHPADLAATWHRHEARMREDDPADLDEDAEAKIWRARCDAEDAPDDPVRLREIVDTLMASTAGPECVEYVAGQFPGLAARTAQKRDVLVAEIESRIAAAGAPPRPSTGAAPRTSAAADFAAADFAAADFAGRAAEAWSSLDEVFVAVSAAVQTLATRGRRAAEDACASAASRLRSSAAGPLGLSRIAEVRGPGEAERLAFARLEERSVTLETVIEVIAAQIGDPRGPGIGDPRADTLARLPRERSPLDPGDPRAFESGRTTQQRTTVKMAEIDGEPSLDDIAASLDGFVAELPQVLGGRRCRGWQYPVQEFLRRLDSSASAPENLCRLEGAGAAAADIAYLRGRHETVRGVVTTWTGIDV